MRRILTLDDAGKGEVEAILRRAAALQGGASVQPRPFSVLLAFFQSSTRTRVGFAAAAAALGGSPIPLLERRHHTGMSAAESLADTMRCASGQVDLVVLRHHDAVLHAQAAAACVCPVINAGDGGLHHPTQALVDLFAIKRHHGHLGDLRVGLVGDLGSRSAHSLVQALRWWPPSELRLCHPLGRGLEASWLEGHNPARVVTTDRLEPEGLHVIYMVGLPAGEGDSRLSAEQRAQFTLMPSLMERTEEGTQVLCPLPRIDEIAPALDDDPRAQYFQQSDEGRFVRMAVLEWVLERG